MDMAALGAQIASLQRENSQLKNRLADRAKEITKRDDDLYAIWLEVHGKDGKLKTNAFGPAAQAAVTRARRAGLDQDDMEKVIRSHARHSFLIFGNWAASGNAKDRKDKLSDAFKNEDRWGALLELADAPVTPTPSPRSKSKYPDYNGYGYSRPVANLFAALERNDCHPFESAAGQGSALCPMHDDRQKSFRFKESDTGSVLMFCNACGTKYYTNEDFCDDVRQMLELPITDLYPNTPNRRS